jgi:hypothetical protein
MYGREEEGNELKMERINRQEEEEKSRPVQYREVAFKILDNETTYERYEKCTAVNEYKGFWRSSSSLLGWRILQR